MSAIITHHNGGLDVLGCLGSAGSSAVLRRCSTLSGGAPVLCWHTQQDTAIAVRHEVDRLGAAGSASNESRSIDHLQVMNSLVGAQWRRRTHECSRTGRGPCASQPPMQQWHAGGSWPCLKLTAYHCFIACVNFTLFQTRSGYLVNLMFPH